MRSDFNQVQKGMEMYAKCVLYETRLAHQEQRIGYLRNEDLAGYVDKHNEQLSTETDLYEEAQNYVKTKCKISDRVFLYSQVEYG